MPESAIRLRVPLAALRPTQVTVGMRAVAAKRDKVAQRAGKHRKIADYLERRPIPAVRGPGKAYYIIDRHHLGLALWQSDVRTAYVSVLADLSALRPGAFWREMVALGCAYPFDEQGTPIPLEQIPRALVALRADPFRDLAWSVRQAGGFTKSRVPFAEFRWAEYFRAHIPRRMVRRDYKQAVREAMNLAASHAAEGLPGYGLN